MYNSEEESKTENIEEIRYRLYHQFKNSSLPGLPLLEQEIIESEERGIETLRQPLSQLKLHFSQQFASQEFIHDKWKYNLEADILESESSWMSEQFGELKTLDKKIRWIKGNHVTIQRKACNEEWLSRTTPQDIMEEIRAAFKELPEATKWTLYPTWVKEITNTQLQKHQGLYQEKLAETISRIEREANLCYIRGRIIWGFPGIVKIAAEIKDSIYYSGSNENKQVYLPFTRLHQQLIEANWMMRNASTNAANYLLAHLVFVVSTEPHPRMTSQEGRYEGGRTIIDFPLVNYLSNIIETLQNRGNGVFDDNEAYQQFMLEEQVDGFSSLSDNIGCYPNYQKERHSEQALKNFLEGNVTNIVALLKLKMERRFGSSHHHKVYAANLFINSQKNICTGCESLLNELYDSSDNSFISLLSLELTNQGFGLPKVNFPYFFITITAYQHYSAYCLETLAQDAEEALTETSTPPPLQLDIKRLAGKVILSSAESWVDNLHPEERKVAIEQRLANTTQRPFYSGFRSASGSNEKLDKERFNQVSLPSCMDGDNLFGITPPTPPLAPFSSRVEPNTDIHSPPPKRLRSHSL